MPRQDYDEKVAVHFNSLLDSLYKSDAEGFVQKLSILSQTPELLIAVLTFEQHFIFYQSANFGLVPVLRKLLAHYHADKKLLKEALTAGGQRALDAAISSGHIQTAALLLLEHLAFNIEPLFLGSLHFHVYLNYRPPFQNANDIRLLLAYAYRSYGNVLREVLSEDEHRLLENSTRSIYSHHSNKVVLLFYVGTPKLLRAALHGKDYTHDALRQTFCSENHASIGQMLAAYEYAGLQLPTNSRWWTSLDNYSIEEKQAINTAKENMLASFKRLSDENTTTAELIFADFLQGAGVGLKDDLPVEVDVAVCHADLVKLVANKEVLKAEHLFNSLEEHQEKQLLMLPQGNLLLHAVRSDSPEMFDLVLARYQKFPNLLKLALAAHEHILLYCAVVKKSHAVIRRLVAEYQQDPAMLERAMLGNHLRCLRKAVVSQDGLTVAILFKALAKTPELLKKVLRHEQHLLLRTAAVSKNAIVVGLFKKYYTDVNLYVPHHIFARKVDREQMPQDSLTMRSRRLNI